MPTQLELRALFVYDGIYGGLVWRHSKRKQRSGKTVGTHRRGYINLHLNGRYLYIHRIIWVMHFGPIPKHKVIDHINGIKDDNRIENLRLVSVIENNRNMSWHRAGKARGVRKQANASTWMARIRVKGEQKYLGSFKTKKEAIHARQLAEQRYG
jgi:hypothetical protein